MRLVRRATMTLPLAVLLAGILVPIMIDRAEVESEQSEPVQARLKGRTGEQWAGAARGAQDAGDFRRALYCIKMAERVNPGTQYTEKLRDIRRARWRQREIASVRGRLIDAPLAGLRFREDGSVAAGRRTVVALPGESLWSLARAMLASERGVLPEEVTDRREVYARWDRLVELNGLRELEVGELVGVPLSDTDMAALESANRADLDRIVAAGEALESGDVNRAEAMLTGVESAFARGTDVYAETAEAVAMVRERSLIEGARAAIDSAQGLSRATNHGERLALLSEAARAISEAEDMRSGIQYADALHLARRLHDEERRYDVRPDGSVLALKAAEESYVDVARDAVEWMLQRELVMSGNAFPNSHLKSDDDRAWARYLILARERAETEGADFEDLLTARDEIVLHLPEPVSVFAD